MTDREIIERIAKSDLGCATAVPARSLPMRKEDKRIVRRYVGCALTVGCQRVRNGLTFDCCECNQEALDALDRLTAEPYSGQEMGRVMEEDESCENKDCQFFDEKCEQNCSGATDYGSPASEECTTWGKGLTAEPTEEAKS